MRRPFFVHGKPSRRGLCRYKRITIINEQHYLERVEKYLFPYTEHRMPRYRWKRMDRNREYFRLTLSGREVEKIFQFHRPFRGKAGFKMSAYRPRFGLVDTISDVEKKFAFDENSVESTPGVGFVRDLKGMVAKSEKRSAWMKWIGLFMSPSTAKIRLRLTRKLQAIDWFGF